MNITFETILGLIGIVSFLGASAIYLRGSADKGTIVSLTNSIAALKTENELHEEKIARQEVHMTAQDGRLNLLEQENNTLREIVTQKREIAVLTKMLDDHHIETVGALGRIEAGVTK